MTDRSAWPTRKLRLHEEEPLDPDVEAMTPGQRVEMVETLTKQAWTFKEGRWDESRLRRDVVRIVRGKG